MDCIFFIKHVEYNGEVYYECLFSHATWNKENYPCNDKCIKKVKTALENETVCYHGQ